MIIERNGSKIELTRAELVEASEEYNWLVAKEVIEDRLVAEMGSVSEKAKEAAVERYKACLDAGNDEDFAIREALAAAKTFAAAEAARLAGGYIMVEAYANLTQEETDSHKDDDETPTCTLCIKEGWLRGFIEPERDSVEEFMNDYTYDEVEGLEQAAREAGALAFVHCDIWKNQIRFFSHPGEDAVNALLNYISIMLKNYGFEGASSWLDDTFGI